MTAMWQVIFYTGFAVIAFYFFLLRPVLQEQNRAARPCANSRLATKS